MTRKPAMLGYTTKNVIPIPANVEKSGVGCVGYETVSDPKEGLNRDAFPAGIGPEVHLGPILA